MTTVKNKIFISLLHKHFYLLGRELSFGWEENRLGAGDTPFLPVGKALLIYIKYNMIHIYIHNKNNIYIYIYVYSLILYHQCSCQNMYRYHQYIQHSYPNIEAKTFAARL